MQMQRNGASGNLYRTYTQPKGLLNELFGPKSMLGPRVMVRHRKLIFS